MNRRSEDRVLNAAAACEPEDYRQAALIGAIAKCLITTGHFMPQTVAALAADNMGWALSLAGNFDESFSHLSVVPTERDPDTGTTPNLSKRIFPLRGYPTMPEITRAARVFKAQYDPPKNEVAA